jgi:imidazolonepropionase-like amidohydrolase
MSDVLHLTGPVLVGPQDVRPELWVVDGRISFSAPTSGEVQTVAGWVLPGLVDAHCHVGLDKDGGVDRATQEQQARSDRDAGTLLIRDAGSPVDTRWVDDREDLPRIVRAGRHIARSRRYIRNFAHEVEPEDVVAYVREEARRSDGWVKLVGDWIDRETGDLSPSFPRETVIAAVQAAHEEGARTTAHCFGEESLRDYAAAGTDCIEHACGLEPDTIAQFAAQGIAIVPTLVNVGQFPALAEPGRARFPTYYDHMVDLHRRRYDTIGAAHDAGVPIYLGTDAGGSLPHGLIRDEIRALVGAGIPQADVIAQASWRGREWLGLPGLDEGAPADLIVYAADPRADFATLQEPRRMVLRGAVIA